LTSSRLGSAAARQIEAGGHDSLQPVMRAAGGYLLGRRLGRRDPSRLAGRGKGSGHIL
jgi:hypothetical protein